ncbi:MAG TPA: hypothetical protein VHZ29_15290 [Rhizomicrobium sp.]|jgi:hypothetical protein|nr:hypothetical protein [Rhizomicrobium sp.]
MRILLAALAAAVAMFVWTAIAHMVTPLGRIGFSEMPNEQAALHAMDDSIGAKPGLYIFPWTDPNDPKMMEKYQAAAKVNPSGMLLYRGPGQDMGGDMTPMLIKEFLKQFAQALIAAWIVSMIAASFITRAGVVTAIGVSAAIATNVSYWNWYGFPFDYTMAQIVIEVVSALVAGLAIAAVLPKRTA